MAEEGAAPVNLADAIRRRIESLGGVELPPAPRGPLRDPPDFAGCTVPVIDLWR